MPLLSAINTTARIHPRGPSREETPEACNPASRAPAAGESVGQLPTPLFKSHRDMWLTALVVRAAVFSPCLSKIAPNSSCIWMLGSENTLQLNKRALKQRDRVPHTARPLIGAGQVAP
jgi:hypothetical protein